MDWLDTDVMKELSRQPLILNPFRRDDIDGSLFNFTLVWPETFLLMAKRSLHDIQLKVG